jgi:ABC-type transport system involved in multi-copper enzyme maturation permease subunit
MKNLLRAEFYKLSHSLPFIALCILGIGVYLLLTNPQNRVGLSEEYIYALSAANPFPMMWIGVVAAPFLIGTEFVQRTINGAVVSGHSRTKIALVKALCWYLTVAAIVAVSLGIAVVIHAPSWASGNIGFVLGRIALCVVISCGTASFPFLFAFIFRDLFYSMGTAAIFTYIAQHMISSSDVNGRLHSLLNFYPAYMQTHLRIWVIGGDGDVLTALLCSFTAIVITIAAGCCIISKCELK